MTLDFTPRPAAAPLARMIRSQIGIELRLLLRNGEQVGLALVIPLLLLLAGTKSGSIIDLGEGRSIDIIAPGVLALAIMSTSFTSLAIATGFERRYGVLKRLGATPLPRSGLLAGKIGAVLVVEALQLVVLSIFAFLLGWDPADPLSGAMWLGLLALVSTAAFGGLGLLIAGTLRPEATLAVANLIYVLLLVGGAVIVPLDQYPESLQNVIAFFPSAALGEGLRNAASGVPPAAASFGILALWAAVGSLATIRTFKWE